MLVEHVFSDVSGRSVRPQTDFVRSVFSKLVLSRRLPVVQERRFEQFLKETTLVFCEHISYMSKSRAFLQWGAGVCCDAFRCLAARWRATV